MNEKGRLFLIPNTLGETTTYEVLPLAIPKIIADINHFIVENEKIARRYIKSVVPQKNQNTLHLDFLNKFTKEHEIPDLLNPCHQGTDVGLISDAGCPAIADPGATVVRLAHKESIEVIPLVGPSSIILALMGSGLNGQNFSFNGYLPVDKNECKRVIKHLERKSENKQQAQICIETPYRNMQLFNVFIKNLKPSTNLCVAADLTLKTQQIKTKTVKAWRTEQVHWHKRPAIFIFQA